MKGKIRYIKLLFFCIYLVVCLGLYEHLFVYHVKFNGNPHEVVNIYSRYEDEGINVKYRGHNYKKIKIDNNVNTNKPGIYRVIYSFNNIEKVREVEVRDIESPVIELKGESVILNYKEEYKEPGFSAYDNFDGDISKSVIVSDDIDNTKVGRYKVNYSVSDSSNNERIITRNVIVKDEEGPKITFKMGVNPVILRGNNIKFDDYTAIDNYDGDITSKVSVTGSVDTNKVGNYKLVYNVSDSFGNTTLIKRTVSVQEKNTLGIPVLMYHWFYDDTVGDTWGSRSKQNYMSKSKLESHIKYTKDNNYHYVTWNELIDYIDGKIDLPEKSIIFTDDDCEDTFFDIALPVFQKYEVPVTSFCIARKSTYLNYLKAPYLDLESHTNDLHTRKCDTSWNGAVMCSDYDTIYDDIKLSIKKLGNGVSFAYPFGHYNDLTIKALKNNGIKLAFTTHGGRVRRGANKYLLPRVRMNHDVSMDSFEYLVR